MRASGAVTRSTLRQQIADALRDEVLAGRLQPGREFTVKQIAEQYGVSATPVREALFDLSAQGLLESDQHRGFRVHEFTVADYRAMVEARTLVMDGVIREVFTGPPPRRRSRPPTGMRSSPYAAGPRRPPVRRAAATWTSSSATTCASGASWARSSATATSPTSCTGCASRPGCSPSRTCAVTPTYGTGCGTGTPNSSPRSRTATARRCAGPSRTTTATP